MMNVTRGLIVCGCLLAAAQASAMQQGPDKDVSRYALPVFDQVDVKEQVVFASVTTAGGNRIDLGLDIYQPAGETERARPAILWIHGGGFKPGTDKRQKYIVTMATDFARRGYVSFAADYRVREHPETDRMATLRDAVDDCRAALAWMRANRETCRIDPDRIIVAGGSAGGKAAVSLVAVENADAAAAKRRGVVALVDLWGSPGRSLMLKQVGREFPPTVIVHGTADETVPFSQTEQLVEDLKAQGVEHVLMAIPDAAHTPTDHMAEILETTAGFLSKVLRGLK